MPFPPATLGPKDNWLFELLAPVYDRVSQGLLTDPGRVVAMVAPSWGERLLDVGGGTGQVGLALAEAGARVTVLDASPRMLSQVPRHHRVTTLSGTATSLPFPDATFDTVVCCAAFHLFDPQVQALSAMRRVLRAGGRLYLQDLDPSSALGILLPRGGLPGQPLKFLSAAQLGPLLKEQGFSGQFRPFNLLQYAFIGAKAP